MGRLGAVSQIDRNLTLLPPSVIDALLYIGSSRKTRYEVMLAFERFLSPAYRLRHFLHSHNWSDDLPRRFKLTSICKRCAREVAKPGFEVHFNPYRSICAAGTSLVRPSEAFHHSAPRWDHPH
jgi:hypothetical protein